MSKNSSRYGKTNGLKKEIVISENLTYPFLVANQNHKVIEAYNRMKNNHGSDLELQKLL